MKFSVLKRISIRHVFCKHLSMAEWTLVGQSLPIIGASDHTQAHHNRQDSSDLPQQRPLPDNKHNIHKRQTPMFPVGFEPTISASEQPQTHVFDRARSGIGFLVNCKRKPENCGPQNTNKIPLFLHRATCRFTKYHTTNKYTNCMSFILNHFFKTLFLLLHVSIAYRISSSGSTHSSQIKSRVKNMNFFVIIFLWQHILYLCKLFLVQGGKSSEKCFKKVI